MFAFEKVIRNQYLIRKNPCIYRNYMLKLLTRIGIVKEWGDPLFYRV